jgi:hypothetical protein
VCAAIWLYQLASLSPAYTVQAVDFAGEQQELQPYTERDEYLAQLPLDRYIQEVIAQKLVQVQGEGWDEFFTNVSAASNGQPAAAQWTERIADPGGSRPARLYFRTDEPPLNALAGPLAPTGSGLASPPAPTNPALPLAARDKSVEWERTFAGELPAGDGRAVLQTEDGGYLVAGDYAPGERTLFALKTDAQGARQWLAMAGPVQGELIAHSLVQTGDGGYLVAGETRWISGKSSAIYLLKIVGTGVKQWEKSYAWSLEGRIDDCNLSIDGRDRATLTAWSGDAVYQLRVDAAGRGGWAPPITLSGLADSDQVGWIQPTADGGFVVAGVTQSRPGGFKDALLAKSGASGKLVWRKVFGGDRSETASYVRLTGDGGYLLAGKAQPRSIDDDDLYLVKTNGDGDREWEGTFGDGADQSGATVQPSADGGWLALADSQQGIYLVKTDRAGVRQWEQYLGESGYHAAAVYPTRDGGAALTGAILTGSLDAFLIKTRGE